MINSIGVFRTLALSMALGLVAGCGNAPAVSTDTTAPSPSSAAVLGSQLTAPAASLTVKSSTASPVARVTMEPAEPTAAPDVPEGATPTPGGAGATLAPQETFTSGTDEAAATFQNPVLAQDFPDPGVLKVGVSFYAYATNAWGYNVPVARSNNLTHWQHLGDALPVLGSWAQASVSRVWGPEVAKVGERYVLYYTAQDKTSERQCTGVATSETPEGPFQDTRADPLICRRTASGWTIDPSPFVDGDKRYLYYGAITNDGTTLYVQALAPDGMSVQGEATALTTGDAAWEAGFVGGPQMWKHDGRYYLFFAGNQNESVDRGIGYATCESAVGPCTDAPENPILTSKLNATPSILSPGGPAIVQTEDGRTWLVYHAGESQSQNRMLWLDRLTWNDGQPVVEGPTSDPQPLP